MKLLHQIIVLPIIACSLAFSGCTTGSSIMAVSGGAYTVTKSGTTGFTPLGVIRKEAYEEVNQFAASKGMVAEVISVNEVPAGFARWPQVDLRFRLVSPAVGNAGAKVPALTIGSQASHDAMGKTTEAETTVVVSKEPDFYTEIKKLGELKAKGLLTDEEFQREKNRLLDARKK